MIKTEMLKTKSKIKLPEVLDANIADDLKSSLLALITENKAIEIDASAVGRMDTLCSQLLLSAKRTCNDQDISFIFTKRSDTIVKVLAILDMQSELLGES